MSRTKIVLRDARIKNDEDPQLEFTGAEYAVAVGETVGFEIIVMAFQVGTNGCAFEIITGLAKNVGGIVTIVDSSTIGSSTGDFTDPGVINLVIGSGKISPQFSGEDIGTTVNLECHAKYYIMS